MVTEIYVVSGFLGSGKTTLIQKLLNESFHGEKVVLIENDFGTISVDAALLRSSSVEVREINSGCICCSLAGDFVKALKEVLDRFHPNKIIIEPSGVGKLSDVVRSCSDQRIQSLSKVKSKITVVDVKRCNMYLDNFGDFFEDQILHADFILLSHTEEAPDKVNAAMNVIRRLNPHSVIISKPWNQLDVTFLFCTKDSFDHHMISCCQNEDHSFHYHSACHNNHSAKDNFDTVTIRPKHIFTDEDLKRRVLMMRQLSRCTVIRAKGIVHGTNGYVNLQYVPGEVQITKCEISGNMISIIGKNLNYRELSTLFGGE